MSVPACSRPAFQANAPENWRSIVRLMRGAWEATLPSSCLRHRHRLHCRRPLEPIPGGKRRAAPIAQGTHCAGIAAQVGVEEQARAFGNGTCVRRIQRGLLRRAETLARKGHVVRAVQHQQVLV